MLHKHRKNYINSMSLLHCHTPNIRHAVWVMSWLMTLQSHNQTTRDRREERIIIVHKLVCLPNHKCVVVYEHKITGVNWRRSPSPHVDSDDCAFNHIPLPLNCAVLRRLRSDTLHYNTNNMVDNTFAILVGAFDDDYLEEINV